MSLRKQIKRAVLQWKDRANSQLRKSLGQEDGIAVSNWGVTISPDGALTIGGCDVGTLAREYGTPLFVVNRHRLEADFHAFRNSFQSRYRHVEIGCSYKTNPLPSVLRVLHDSGALAEVISHFELWLAIRLGVPPNRILFNGPGKGREAIELAVQHGVKLINIDSVEEIDVIAQAARAAGRKQPVGVRVVTSVGWSSQFGLTIASGDALEAFRTLCTKAECEPVGLHVHLGTGIRDVQTYLQAVREMLEFAQSLRGELGVEITYFDLGGGFGVPTVRSYDAWDQRLMANAFPPAPTDLAAAPSLDDYATGIVSLVRQFYPQEGPRQPTLAFEPGRAIMSSAQSLILKVLTIKRGKFESPTVILDGGKNVAMPTGWELHELVPVQHAAESRTHRYNFFGPLCHPGDSLFVEKPFPPLAPGDFVSVMDAGAYFVPNQMNFSHPRAAAVLVDNGHATLIRSRETFDDIIARDLTEGYEASIVKAADSGSPSNE